MPAFLAAAATTAALAALGAVPAETAIAVCPPPPARRTTCVHDGDTIWLDREKIRIMEIDAPELDARDPETRARAIRVRNQLVEMLREGDVRIERHGQDCYGRTLARVFTAGGPVAPRLIEQGDTRRYTGPTHPVCRRSAAESENRARDLPSKTP